MPNQESQTSNNNNTRQRNKSIDQEFGCALTFGQQRCCLPEWIWWSTKETRPNFQSNNYYYDNSNNQQRNCNEDIPKLISVNNKRIV